LTAIIFGQLLEARRDMYRIADCCQEEAIPVAKLAQDHVAGMESDADCNRLRQLVSQCSIHVGETAIHKLRSNQRLGASLTRPGVYAEDRHHAVADELVGYAAGIDYRACHGIEEVVEQEHHVIREPLLDQEGVHDADPRELARLASRLGSVLPSRLAIPGSVFRLGKLDDVVASIHEREKLAALGKRDRLLEFPRPATISGA
jgi:hypothetical protein